MSVAYFEKTLGHSVLSSLGLAQNFPWLISMGALCLRTRNDYQPPMQVYGWVISLTHLYMFGMCLLFPIVVYNHFSVSVSP